MEKYFNWLTVIFGLLGGTIVNFLGGMDKMLHVLIFLIVIDFITGLTKALVNRQLSSQVGFKGITKKVAIFLVVAIAVELEMLMGDSIPLRSMTIMFYVANEGLSLVENLGDILPLPQQIKNVFVQIRDKNEEEQPK
ncbi:phage holin family protein [Vagococcus intermedius]|uniref:Phage holin family protein n=1 Tax=Vagococcus intermedius TaxID=2991418 RepID=A0AAF0CWW0_9ENTE|nr:phage holin family protein [Vagococcus intermedius]WEG74367.1 phage holin family protein [Vagococcus intermedius]WEG76490.1 phage holin family protein [Vagococcus intermedius]